MLAWSLPFSLTLTLLTGVTPVWATISCGEGDPLELALDELSAELSPKHQILVDRMKKVVVGNDHLKEELVDIINHHLSLREREAETRGPIGAMLLAGPKGTGKTTLVEALAYALFGNRKAFTKINGGEFGSDHEVAKVIGSPPGYIGHDKSVELLRREVVAKHQTDEFPINIVLIDEIEKADDKFQEILLSVLDDGTLRNGKNQEVDHRDTFFIFTSNVGAGDVERAATRREAGFTSNHSGKLTAEREEGIFLSALKKVTSPEFRSRIDVRIMDRLDEDQWLKVTDMKLDLIRDQFADLDLQATDEVIQELHQRVQNLPETDGRRAEKYVQRVIGRPIARFLSAGGLKPGDGVRISVVDGEFKFHKVKASPGFEPFARRLEGAGASPGLGVAKKGASKRLGAKSRDSLESLEAAVENIKAKGHGAAIAVALANVRTQDSILANNTSPHSFETLFGNLEAAVERFQKTLATDPYFTSGEIKNGPMRGDLGRLEIHASNLLTSRKAQGEEKFKLSGVQLQQKYVRETTEDLASLEKLTTEHGLVSSKLLIGSLKKDVERALHADNDEDFLRAMEDIQRLGSKIMDEADESGLSQGVLELKELVGGIENKVQEAFRERVPLPGGGGGELEPRIFN